MASVIGQALSSVPGYQGAARHDTGISGLDYHAANIEERKASPSTIHQIFDQIVGTAAPIMTEIDKGKQASAQDDYLKQKALLSEGKITQQDFNTWVNQGDMFWKDNPYAQKVARHDIGQQARLDADAMIERDKDKYKTLDEMHEALRQARSDSFKKYSDLYGLKEDDEDFLKGAGNGLVDADVHLSETWNSWKSTQDKNVATMGAYTNVNNLVHDTNGYDNPKLKAGQILASMELYTKNGVINDVQGQTKFYQDTVQELANQPNGAAVIEELRKSNINLNGVPTPMEDVIGSETFTAASNKAATATVQQNATLYQQFYDEKAKIDAEPDPVKQRQMSSEFETKFSSILYPAGDKSAVNEFTQQYQSTRNGIQENEQRAAKQASEAHQAELKADNGRRQARANIGSGDIIPDNWEWREDLNGPKNQAYTNAMNDEVARITTQYKDDPVRMNQEIMSLAARDRGGFMQNYVNAQIKDGTSEWRDVVHAGGNGSLTDKPKLKGMVELYRSNPSLFRQMMTSTKEGQDLEARVELIADGRFDIQQLAQSEQIVEGWDEGTKKVVDTNWGQSIQSPANSVRGAPASVLTTAREIYNITYAKTGSTKEAILAANTYADKQIVDFDDSDTSQYQAVPSLNKVSKGALNLDGNEANIPRVKAMVSDIMTEKNGSIENSSIFEDTYGRIGITNIVTGQTTYWSKDALRKEFEKRFKTQVEESKKERERKVSELGLDRHQTTEKEMLHNMSVVNKG